MEGALEVRTAKAAEILVCTIFAIYFAELMHVMQFPKRRFLHQQPNAQ